MNYLQLFCFYVTIVEENRFNNGAYTDKNGGAWVGQTIEYGLALVIFCAMRHSSHNTYVGLRAVSKYESRKVRPYAILRMHRTSHRFFTVC
jgi:hypothetical protein